MTGKLGILVCENLFQEFRAALQASALEDVSLIAFPSDCIRPPASWQKLESRVSNLGTDLNGIIVFASTGCIPPGDPPESLSGCELRRLEQCTHLFLDRRVADARIGEGAYFLTPGWLARWRQYLKDWGFDQQTAGDFFADFATRLVLLDTGVDAQSRENLEEMASYVRLPMEIIPAGLDSLRLNLENLVLRWQMGRAAGSTRTPPSGGAGAVDPPQSDYAMAFDLVDTLAGIMTEAEAIERVFDLFTMLFAPARLAYLPIENGQPGPMMQRPPAPFEPDELRESMVRLGQDCAWSQSGDGFLLLVAHHGEKLGVLQVHRLAFPEHRERYLNLALTIGKLCGLAVSNARTYERMKRTELALEAESERLAVTLRSIGDGLIATDTAGRVVILNRVAEKLTGWSQAEASGRPLSEVFQIMDQHTREPSEDPVRKVLATGSVVELQNGTALVSRDGQMTIIADSAAPVHDATGRTIGVVLVFRDVTERQKQTLELETSRERLSRLYEAERSARAEAEAARRQAAGILESITDAFFALDTEWHLTYVNQEAERLLHKPREALMGRSLWEEFPEAVGSTFYNEYHRAMKEQEAVRFEEYYPPFDTWYEVHAFPSRTSLSVYFQDINGRRQAQEDLRKLSRVVEQSPASVVITDTAGNIEYVNPKFTEATGYTTAEVLGKNPRILKSGEKSPEEYRDLWETLTAGREWRGEFHNKRKNGELYWESASISPIRDQAGNITDFLAVKEDITERKRVEDEVRSLNQRLERRATELTAINDELESFAYSVSHDLRAPLRHIDGFSQALLEDYEDKLDEQGKNYLNRVRAASQKMGHLIDDILMLSRVTRREMRRQKVNLSSLVDGIAQELKRNEPERLVDFVIQPGIIVQGDPDLLRIALDNLINNAWKFTSTRSSGKIEFGTLLQDGKQAYFVRDNGVGFDMTYADKLFGAFQRLHAAEDFPGTGIGLATVQRIIHRHGGRIWAEAQIDQGATFHFSLSE